eukprot:TRINITY_DN26508_c0_g1_i1.p1 TRINITY_DN26508_c0_g1~~TRINITY_DN26508_c0_g1_i1.p1  ORF type:complete len:1052 (+),score=280.70 TRINITY_DN26508_c0_g1_i1:142-3297(+)
MATAGFTGGAGVDVQALFVVFQHSYSASALERQHAEASLQSAEQAPGFLTALLRIAAEPRVEQAIRQAAAIQLKNQVKRWWDVSAEGGAGGYVLQEKAAVRDGLVEALAAAALTAPLVRAQLLECLRLVALHDFPHSWPGLTERLLAGLGSEEPTQTYCSLLALRKLFKQLEARSVARRDDMETLCNGTLPVLKALIPPLAQAATTPGTQSLQAMEMLKLVLKCAYSSLYMKVSEAMCKEIDAWMSFVHAIAGQLTPASSGVPEEQSREAVAFAKVRKWAFTILYRFFNRHGQVRRAVIGTEGFAKTWAAAYLVSSTDLCLREVCQGDAVARRPVPGPSSRITCLALVSLANACFKDEAFAVMRPHLKELMEHGIFAWVSFGERDLRIWQQDPEEVVRGDIGMLDEPRVAAIELLQRLVRHRSEEVLLPLLHFCRHHLEAHRAAGPAASQALCANMDGALRILGSLAEELLGRDPQQVKKPKKKKAGGKKGTVDAGSDINVEELIERYVRPLLSSEVPFLRLRACWFLEQVMPRVQLSVPQAGAEICKQCLRLATDESFPVRVQACTCLQAFLQRDDPGVQHVVVENLAGLLETLLRTLAEVQSDEMSQTLEQVVSAFPEEIVPFAVRLVEQLVGQYCRAIAAVEDGEEDDGEFRGAGTLTTIVTIMECCACSLQDATDAVELQKQALLFSALAGPLLPMLAKVLQPEGIDFLEEALQILTCLLLHGPSPVAPALWSVFPRLYESVCGSPIATSKLPREGWATDHMPELAEPIACLMVQGPSAAFLGGTWPEAGLTYPDMLVNMVDKVLQMSGIGAERDCASAAQLVAALYEGIQAPHGDRWFPRCFRILWSRFPSAETAQLRAAVVTAFAAMLWYNAELFLRASEEQGCTQSLFGLLLQHVGLVKSSENRRLVLLGLLRIFQLAANQALPPVLLAGMPQVVQRLAELSKAVLQGRAQRDVAPLHGGRTASEESSDEEASPPKSVTSRGTVEDGDETDMVFAVRSGLSTNRHVDEIAALRSTLEQAPPSLRQQVEGCLGSPGALTAWLAQL